MFSRAGLCSKVVPFDRISRPSARSHLPRGADATCQVLTSEYETVTSASPAQPVTDYSDTQ